MQLSFHLTDHFSLLPALILARPPQEPGNPALVVAFEFCCFAVVLDLG